MRIRCFLLRSIVFAEESLDFRDHGSGLTRLGEVSVAADLHRLLAIGRKRVRRQRDDGDSFRRRIVLQHLDRFPSPSQTMVVPMTPCPTGKTSACLPSASLSEQCSALLWHYCLLPRAASRLGTGSLAASEAGAETKMSGRSWPRSWSARPPREKKKWKRSKRL